MSFEPTPGKVLEARYVLRSPLGHGGMGTVWRAEHTKLKTAVAVKLIARAHAASDESLTRFRREAQVAAALESPNIVRILDFGIDDGTPYIAMELLEGETLGARLSRSGPMSPADTARIAAQIARGIGRAHQAQVVHCDLKPDNIFLAQIDGEEIVKVLDFGVAKAPLLDPLTASGAVLGTLQYMSPEQLEGRRGIGVHSDLYSFAVIVFECLCGRPAFGAESIAELVRRICGASLPVPSEVASVPPGFDAWFLRAAHRTPSSRFANAREMSDALAIALGISPAQSVATAPTASASRPSVTHPIAETVSAARTFGSERAGFRLTADPRARLLEMELWGMWDLPMGVAFRAEIHEALTQMRGAPWVVLALSGRHPPQSEEVRAIHAETMAAGSVAGMVRTAFVIDSALAKMSARRLADETKMQNARFFGDESEARAWLADTDIFARRGGSERAGFVVHPNPHSRVLDLEFWGLWDMPTALAFRTEILRAYRVMEGRPWVVLSQSRRYLPQKEDVQAVHGEVMGVAKKHGLVRVAFLVDTALSQMQIRRLFEEAGSPPHLRFFTDESEARRFLAEALG
jgi:hypothetical protein